MNFPPWTTYINETIRDLAQIKEEIAKGNYDQDFHVETLKRSIDLLQNLRDDLKLMPEKINKIIANYTD